MLPLSEGVGKKASCLRSKSPSVAASTGARRVQNTVSAGTHFYNANDEDVF